MKPGPIFIGGLERSGTSLIYALLASHPKIAMTRRTNLWTYFHNQFGDLSNPKNFERCLKTMMRYKRLLVLDPDPDRIREEFWKGEPTYGFLFNLLWSHYADKLNKPRWGDKSLNTERYADQVFEAYPNARFIHMIRDPRDRYASVLTRWKVRKGGVGAGIAMWLSSVDLAKRNQFHYPGRYMIVPYETLVNRPEETLGTICNFIEEDYSQDMLMMQGAETFRDEGGNSSYGQLEPGVISTKSIGRFRKVLTKRQIYFMQLFAKREMAHFNYTIDDIHLPVGEKIFFNSFDLPFNLAKMGVWLTREAYLNKMGRVLPNYRIVSSAPNNL